MRVGVQAEGEVRGKIIGKVLGSESKEGIAADSSATLESTIGRLLTSTTNVEGFSTTDGRVESIEIDDGEVEKEERLTVLTE